LSQYKNNLSLITANPSLRRGYTFIEVLIALFIIAVMILVFATAQQTTLLTKKMREETIASHIAERQMEELRSMNFASINSSASLSDPDVAKLTSGIVSRAVSDFANDDADGEDELKLVTITVTWQSLTGTRVLNVTTLVTRQGINPAS
jgi:prepilin-type N-terminal cleavage/methylation domain-containing protein